MPGNRPYWTRPGVVKQSGEGLRISASGYIVHSPGSGLNPDHVCFPEGYYPDDPTNTSHANNPDGVGGYDGNEEAYVCTNIFPVCLAMVILPVGQTPPSEAGSVDDAIRVGRSYYSGGLESGEVWLILNDREEGSFYSNNSGAFSVVIQRESDSLVVDLGSPSPTRFVPPGILAMKQSVVQHFAWCLAVKPVRGAWEGYCDYDVALSLPEYADQLGSVIPAQDYRPAGASLSTLAMELKLGATATDVTVLAPIESALAGFDALRASFLDRAKLRNHYYDDAEWILFEVIPPGDSGEALFWQAGRCGNVGMGDASATIELTSYEEIANRKVGDVLHVICQVGARRGENFGTGRCRNEVLNDGPLRANWTVQATVVSAADYNKVQLSYGATAISSAALHADFHNRLANGDLEFGEDSEVAGENFGIHMGIKSGAQVSPGVVDVVTKISLPHLPQAGDVVNLVAGCRRTKSDCLNLYNNLPNMRASDLPGNDDVLRRTRE